LVSSDRGRHNQQQQIKPYIGKICKV